VFGIEASPHRAQAASAQGVKTAIEPVERLAPDTFGTVFDLVISNHVIEHCVDPHAFMEGVCRVLRPGGWLCLAAPNQGHDFLIQNFFFALHIHHYSRTSMRRLLAAHGFTVQRFQEDHELRVLAQYRPSTACFSRLPVLERPEWTDRAAAAQHARLRAALRRALRVWRRGACRKWQRGESAIYDDGLARAGRGAARIPKR
jgi:SAM-dependent methyltransferase